MDAMVQVSKVRKGDTILGPSGWVTVQKVSKNAVGRTVFDTDGKPFPAFSRDPQGVIFKRTQDAPVVPVATDAELAEVLAPVGELTGELVMPKEVTSATETAQKAAPKVTARKTVSRRRRTV